MLLSASFVYMSTGSPSGATYALFFRAPAFLALAAHAVVWAIYWRLGPGVFKHRRMFRLLLPFTAAFTLVTHLRGALGTHENMAFGNPVHFLVAAAIQALIGNTLVSILPMNPPSAPETSFLRQFWNGFVMTARYMDCLTDITYVSHLIEEVRTPQLPLCPVMHNSIAQYSVYRS